MLRLKQFIRTYSTKTDFPKDCGWEDIINGAKCKKEPRRLDPVEQTGKCLALPEKERIKKDVTTDITPVTGVPGFAYERNTAIIQRHPKNVMQQGTANTRYYVLSYTQDVQWENPLMGWTSGSNSLKDVEIRFPTKEAAIEFADKNGWNLIVPKEEGKKKFHKNYGENFAWNKRTRVSTK